GVTLVAAELYDECWLSKRYVGQLMDDVPLEDDAKSPQSATTTAAAAATRYPRIGVPPEPRSDRGSIIPSSSNPCQGSAGKRAMPRHRRRARRADGGAPISVVQLDVGLHPLEAALDDAAGVSKDDHLGLAATEATVLARDPGCPVLGARARRL